MRQKKALPTTKQSAAQVEPSKRAAKLKAANAAKRPQPLWLRQPMPVLQSDPPPAPERSSAAHQSQGPPRLLDKAEILAITHVSFPTVWSGCEPDRSRGRGSLVGKSMWLSTEIDAWIASLRVRPLKGDPLEAM